MVRFKNYKHPAVNPDLKEDLKERSTKKAKAKGAFVPSGADQEVLLRLNTEMSVSFKNAAT